MKTALEEAVDLYKTQLAFADLDPSWVDIETLKDWLWTCDHNHGGPCREALAPDDTVETRPQWLVDIRRRCLVPAGPDDQYAALSYVWGNVCVTQTTTSNLHTFLEPGSLSSPQVKLPRTISHAIGLLDLLEIRFLWVDALCIVQDDAAIKQKQIHAMAWIYANAYVTIIAADGWDADHGLRGIQGVTESRYLNKDTAKGVDKSLKAQAAKWYSRGWTYQEMIFSKRRIMFHNQTVLWECPRASWNESFLNSVFKIHQTPVQPKITAWPDIRQYMATVRDYNMREFTDPQEALNAISSLLAVWKYSYDGGFISGLPQMFFLETLLWQPEEPLKRRVKKDEQDYKRPLPSWSWAGWEGAVDIKSWEAHYSHLHILPHPRKDQYVWQVKHTVQWHCFDALGAMSRIRPSSLDYRPKKLFTYDIPEGWELRNHWPRHSSSYGHARLDGLESRYPIPLFRQPGGVVSSGLLYGKTRRGFFESNWERPRNVCPSTICDEILLLDKQGSSMGVLRLNTASFYTSTKWYYNPTHISRKYINRPVEDETFEMVEIAQGTVLGDETVNCWGDFGFKLTEMPEVPIPMKTYSQPEKGIVYVMWIKWKDGIAYRHGLGRVLKTAWQRDATEEIDLILGPLGAAWHPLRALRLTHLHPMGTRVPTARKRRLGAFRGQQGYVRGQPPYGSNLNDLVTLIQAQNAQPVQDVLPTSDPEVGPGDEHPWIPETWKHRTSGARDATLANSNQPLLNDASGSSNPFLERAVITPATTAYSTPGPSAPSSRVDELSPIKAEQLLHGFRTLYAKHTPFLYPYAFPKPPPTANPSARTNEERRAVLGCFLTTSIVSCYMRFEAARWKPHFEESLIHLWEVPEAPSDRPLAALTRIMAIVDEATRLSFRIEDPDTGPPPIFHIKALLASLQQVKGTFTADILENYMVKAQLYSAEAVIYELATFQPPSESPFKSLDYKRREYLHACLEAAKNFLDLFLTIEPEEYPGLPFWIMIEYAHSSQVIYRLSLLDDPGWDRSMARQTADIIYYLEKVASNMDQAHDVGDYSINGTDSLFKKAAASLRMTIPTWTANLEQVGAFTAAQISNSASRANEPIDPMLMDFTDDTWLTDMFASWEGH
ncbi:putative Heterokaryon incompatibility protein-domain-containing protein [Seiridium cardinale]|uniref:Heterokaryon incompatibility protein-domain-containing protein n=1 Tax=Seiridium cardinale TaxID=138064 RepID=A0ABR2X5Y5_9PEZI